MVALNSGERGAGTVSGELTPLFPASSIQSLDTWPSFCLGLDAPRVRGWESLLSRTGSQVHSEMEDGRDSASAQ